MSKSIYIVGGAGSGKSTFMASLLDEYVMGYEIALTELHETQNANGGRVRLRGHWCDSYDGVRGIYLGFLRDEFPGTDGLDSASPLPGREWLRAGDLPGFILGEGMKLTTDDFLADLDDMTDLLVVHLYAEPFVIELRWLARGAKQSASFVHGISVSRARNRATMLEKRGTKLLTVDTADPAAVALALAACLAHLKGTDQ